VDNIEQSFLTSTDGSFNAQQNFDQGVSISFFGQPGVFWFLDFAAPNNQLLTVGAYTGAMRFPFQNPGQPGWMLLGMAAGATR